MGQRKNVKSGTNPYGIQMRVGGNFVNTIDIIKREVAPTMGRKPSDREITDGFSKFMRDERLIEHFVRSGKKRGGWL